MAVNIAKEVAALERMTVRELKAKYQEVFDDETKTGNKAWLVKRIAWRIQANAEGGLSERARMRAEEIANDADIRRSPPKLKPVAISAPGRTKTSAVAFSEDNRLPLPGAILSRKYKGENVQVRVLEKGFDYQGEVFRSLSAVAKRITGTHTNGYLFFKLQKGGDR